MSGPTPSRPGPARAAALDVAMGVGVAAWYALPDVVESRAARGALKTAVFLAGTGIVAARARATDVGIDAFDPTATVGVQPPGTAGSGLVGSVGRGSESQASGPAADMGPRTAGAVAAGVLTASLAGTLLLDRGMSRTAGWLRRRGLRRPYTVIGAGIGLATALSRPSRNLGA